MFKRLEHTTYDLEINILGLTAGQVENILKAIETFNTVERGGGWYDVTYSEGETTVRTDFSLAEEDVYDRLVLAIMAAI